MKSAAVQIARRVLVPVIETLLPSRCWATDVAITSADGGLSKAAREAIALGLETRYCARCGMGTGPHTRHDRANPCVNCAKRKLGVTTIARAGVFSPPLSELVKIHKFAKRWELAELLAPFVVQAIEKQAAEYGLKVDLLVPIPLHWRREFSRGFNQAEEIARAMRKLKGWPMAKGVRRVRGGKQQSLTQSAEQRHENMSEAFAAKASEKLAGKHVWLIDDVCTTGATIHAAALALKRLPKELRPARIHAAVVCVTDRVAEKTAEIGRR
jgi:ComF family protein